MNDVREAERQISRRARALALERTRGGGETLRLDERLVVTPAEGRWRAEVSVCAGTDRLVQEAVVAADPSAAVVALAAHLGASIRSACERLSAGLREGIDAPDPDPVATVEPTPKRRRSGR